MPPNLEIRMSLRRSFDQRIIASAEPEVAGSRHGVAVNWFTQDIAVPIADQRRTHRAVVGLAGFAKQRVAAHTASRGFVRNYSRAADTAVVGSHPAISAPGLI